jgi:hypothetical protein
MEEILQTFELFLRSSPERIREVDAQILSHLESLESCAPFFDVLESTDNLNYLWIAYAAIAKAINRFWEGTGPEIKMEFLTKFNPILFVDKPIFESVLGSFIELVKNEPGSEELLNKTLIACKECLDAATEDKQVINNLKIINELTDVFIRHSRQLAPELVAFILETVECYCNPEFYGDPTKCEALKIAFIIKYKIVYAAVILYKCLVEDEVPEELNEVCSSVFELFAAMFTEFEDLQEISSHQVSLQLFLVKKLIDISFNNLDDDSLPKSILECLCEHIWPCLVNAVDKVDDIYFLSQIIRLLTSCSEIFIISCENFIELIKMAELKQDDVDDFAFQPNIFWENVYSPNSDDADVTSLRNYIASYATSWASFSTEEDLMTIIGAMGGKEYEAYILSRMAPYYIKHQTTSEAILQYTTAYLESATQTFDQLMSLILVVSVALILNIETKMSFLQSHIELFESGSVAVLNAITKLVLALYGGDIDFDVDATSEEVEYFDYIEPSNFLALAVNLCDKVITADLLITYKIIIAHHPEIIEQSHELFTAIVGLLPSVMGDDGTSNGDPIAMEWTYNACNVVYILVSHLGDEHCAEALFNIFEKGLVDDSEPIDDLLKIANECIRHDSPLADRYLEVLSARLNESKQIRAYGRLASLCYINAMIMHPEKSEAVYATVKHVIHLLNPDEYKEDFSCFAAVLAIAIQFNGEIDISDIFEIIAKCIELDDIISKYIATELVASIFVQRSFEIEAPFIEFWLQRLEQSQLVLMRDISMNSCALVNLVSACPQYEERVAAIQQVIAEDPDSLLNLSDASFSEIDDINSICPPTPMFSEVTE